MDQPTAPWGEKPASAREDRADPTAKAAWLLPTGLIILGLIPIVANALRRIALSTGAGDTVAESAPVSLAALLHVAGATVYVILGAFQFSAAFRRRRPTWHRIAGRVLVAAGVLAAVSGLWLALVAYATAGAGTLLLIFRLLAGSGMLLCIAFGYTAIRRRKVGRHRVWMIRAYALGLGAATQVFTLGFGEALFGRMEISVALLNASGWVINLFVAELVVRRRSVGRARRAPRDLPSPS